MSKSNHDKKEIAPEVMILCYQYHHELNQYFQKLPKYLEKPRDVLLQKERIELENQLRSLGFSNIEFLKENAEQITALIDAIHLLQPNIKK